jgi:hypothetical protein
LMAYMPQVIWIDIVASIIPCWSHWMESSIFPHIRLIVP